MKIFYKAFLSCVFEGFCHLANNRGQLNLRGLYLDKEELRKKMSSLWDKRESGDWTPAERKEYDDLASKAKKVNEDLRLRAEYIEDFKMSKDKEDLGFDKSKRDCSLFKIIKQELFNQTRDGSYKDDFGRVNEVLSEHRSKVSKHIKDGFTAIPESAFRSAAPVKRRTDITSGAQGGDSLIAEVVRADQYVEGLYESTWMQRAGVRMLAGLEGDLKIPKIKDRPSFSWIAENSNFAEQDMAFEDVTLQPRYAGAIQVFSLGIFLRAAGNSIVRFVQEELMRSFRAGLEKSFLQDDGTNNTPKGVQSLVPAANIVNASKKADGSAVTANEGGVPSYAEALSVEGKITSTNQMQPLTWLLNDQTRLQALQRLKFSVNGASQLYMGGMFADRPAVITNSVPNDVAKGTGTTSDAYLIQAASLLVGRWMAGLQLQVNTQGAEYWKAGKTAVRVIDVCNMVSRRSSDLAAYRQIKK